MPSGRKKRIMIACVTFETAKVTQPALFYEINKIHIVHYVKDPSSEGGRMYAEFYDRVCEILGEESPLPVEVVGHNERVSDFSVMLRTVLGIIQEENRASGDCEIYVNISSGTSEYAAAAAIASMMVPGTVPFSVTTREYQVPNERIREMYYGDDGKPVGMTKDTYDPRALPTYSIDMPEEHLVRALRILDERNARNLPVTSGAMVPVLKEKGIWYRKEGGSGSRKATQRQTDAVYYQRDFIAKWQSRGWVERDELLGRYVLTDEGSRIIETFYVPGGSERFLRLFCPPAGGATVIT